MSGKARIAAGGPGSAECGVRSAECGVRSEGGERMNESAKQSQSGAGGLGMRIADCGLKGRERMSECAKQSQLGELGRGQSLSPEAGQWRRHVGRACVRNKANFRGRPCRWAHRAKQSQSKASQDDRRQSFDKLRKGASLEAATRDGRGRLCETKPICMEQAEGGRPEGIAWVVLRNKANAGRGPGSAECGVRNTD